MPKAPSRPFPRREAQLQQIQTASHEAAERKRSVLGVRHTGRANDQGKVEKEQKPLVRALDTPENPPVKDRAILSQGVLSPVALGWVRGGAGAGGAGR